MISLLACLASIRTQRWGFCFVFVWAFFSFFKKEERLRVPALPTLDGDQVSHSEKAEKETVLLFRQRSTYKAENRDVVVEGH